MISLDRLCIAFLLAFDDPLEHKRIEVQIADPADMLQLWQKLSK
ncbi:hypothetical protein HMPREF9213_0181 [Lactobacillus iners LactinV 09V1-c]|nr:hypothetical protein HMPREF9213_0181 [Lactobacillus iners LactinV 09V1-c]